MNQFVRKNLLRSAMTRSSLVFVGILIQITATFAQSVIVKGRVMDGSTGTSLPFANVFIDRTTIGTAADGDGYFVLKGAPAGKVELLFSFVGYRLGKVNLNLKEGENEIGVIRLDPAEQQLSEVEIKATRDKTWEKQLAKFEKIFLGDDELADGCKILNPWVLDFSTKEKGMQLTAKADVPLEIENNSLGYKLNFFLIDFWKNAQGYLIEGKVRFEQLPEVDERINKVWLQNREKAYIGSAQHFFKAIINHRIGGEKFKLYTERPGLENATSRSQFFAQAMADALMEYDTTRMVILGMDPNVRQVRLKGRIEVHNYNERSIPRVYRDMGYRVSWIRLDGGEVTVNAEGFPLDPTRVIVSGDMSDQRVSYMLPLDYRKGKIEFKNDVESISWERYKEKVYVHTDKPYYYPGEPIWFAAYLSYGDPILQDSMSKVLYVDLINPSHEVIQSKTILIDNGTASGDFILGETLSPGTYYVRSYTNWSRNFDGGIFVKPFALLNLTDKVDPSEADRERIESDQLSIVSDKGSYKTRDRITLQILCTNAEGDPIASQLSTSITDMSQVTPVKDSRQITRNFSLTKTTANVDTALLRMEYGITVKGRFLNDKGHPESVLLDVLQTNPNSFYLTESDANGLFTLSGIQGYDSVDLFIKPRTAKDRKYGKVELLSGRLPVGEEVNEEVMLKTAVTEFPQRIVSDYEVPKGARMLEAVEIKDTRIDEEAVQRYAESYGKPDYVLDAKHLNTSYGNLLYTLNGQLPGFVARETSITDPTSGKPVWSIYTERARNSSLLFPPPPLILINNVEASGEPYLVLSSIDPATITRIELTTRINSMHGSRGAGGVLAIYTKTGAEIADKPIDPNFLKITIGGFNKPREFKSPDYSTENPAGDYRSTLYWNPSLKTDAETGTASVSFYAADLETTYRVVVEGVTSDNEPVRAVYHLRIENE